MLYINLHANICKFYLNYTIFPPFCHLTKLELPVGYYSSFHSSLCFLTLPFLLYTTQCNSVAEFIFFYVQLRPNHSQGQTP